MPVACFGCDTEPLQLEGKAPITYSLYPENDPTVKRIKEYSGGHLGFFGYMMVINRKIERRTSLSVLDLPDFLWRDAYDAEEEPQSAFERFAEEELSELMEE